MPYHGRHLTPYIAYGFDCSTFGSQQKQGFLDNEQRQNLDKDECFKDFKLEEYRFIVVNRETKLPMVWKFNQTRSVGDIVLGDYKFRNWRVALKELNYYLVARPAIPVNVSYTEENKIEDYFKNE